MRIISCTEQEDLAVPRTRNSQSLEQIQNALVFQVLGHSLTHPVFAHFLKNRAVSAENNREIGPASWSQGSRRREGVPWRERLINVQLTLALTADAGDEPIRLDGT